jgi:radical SAM protein with 4Fe4S-binding SPASM domain
MRQILEHIRLRPKHCVWEVTSRCNMRCLHCASDFGGARPRGAELNLAEALDVCRQLAEMGCEKVVLSGGEALLRDDWPILARELVGLGIHVSLITNGWVVDEETAHEVRLAGVCRVALSLDGLEATHDYVRDKPGSFARVQRACALLRGEGVPVNFVTHVNRMNLPELPAVEERIASLGAAVWRLQLGSPLGRLSRHPELIVLPEDLPEIADFVVAAKQRRRVAVSVGNNIGYFSHHESALRATPNRGGLDFWCGCAAGCLNVGIEANGNVKGCLSLQADEFVEGNLRDERLADVWNRRGAFAYTRDFRPGDLSGHCRGCGYGEICRGGCVFMAYGATGAAHDNPYCLHRVLRERPAAAPAPA